MFLGRERGSVPQSYTGARSPSSVSSLQTVAGNTAETAYHMSGCDGEPPWGWGGWLISRNHWCMNIRHESCPGTERETVCVFLFWLVNICRKSLTDSLYRTSDLLILTGGSQSRFQTAKFMLWDLSGKILDLLRMTFAS